MGLARGSRDFGPATTGGPGAQEVCPYNIKFASELPEGAPFAPRNAIAGKDARTLAREILEISQEEFSTAFRSSPMKRAKLRGLKRNVAVVLGNTGTMEDAPALQRSFDDSDPLVREHAAWARGILGLSASRQPGRRIAILATSGQEGE
jgi:epoxyqueuosine reductase